MHCGLMYALHETGYFAKRRGKLLSDHFNSKNRATITLLHNPTLTDLILEY